MRLDERLRLPTPVYARLRPPTPVCARLRPSTPVHARPRPSTPIHACADDVQHCTWSPLLVLLSVLLAVIPASTRRIWASGPGCRESERMPYRQPVGGQLVGSYSWWLLHPYTQAAATDCTLPRCCAHLCSHYHSICATWVPPPLHIAGGAYECVGECTRQSGVSLHGACHPPHA